MNRVIMIITFDAQEEAVAQAALSTIKLAVHKTEEQFGLKIPSERKMVETIVTRL